MAIMPQQSSTDDIDGVYNEKTLGDHIESTAAFPSSPEQVEDGKLTREVMLAYIVSHNKCAYILEY
jgi:hypothetical protein